MGAIDKSDPRIAFVPEDQAATPPAGLIEHMKDRWWVTHPVEGLVFYVTRGLHSPQRNSNETITRHLRDKLYPWAEVKFIPSVFRRINPSDYA